MDKSDGSSRMLSAHADGNYTVSYNSAHADGLIVPAMALDICQAVQISLLAPVVRPAHLVFRQLASDVGSVLAVGRRVFDDGRRQWFEDG
jgi:hypothetical protein